MSSAHDVPSTDNASGVKDDSTPSTDPSLPATNLTSLHSGTPESSVRELPGSSSVRCDDSSHSESSSQARQFDHQPLRPEAQPISVEPSIWEPRALRGSDDTSTPSKKPPNLSWILFVLVAVCAFLMLTTYVRFLLNSSVVLTRNTTRPYKLHFNASMELDVVN